MFQRTLDFTRADQLGLIRDLRLDVPRCGVSPMALKAVLSAIDDFARRDRECFASIPTLARVACCSERTTKRAIQILVSLSLITRDKRRNQFGVVTNHYRIVWTEISAKIAKDSSPSVGPNGGSVGPFVQTVGPFVQSVGPNASERGAMVAPKAIVIPTQPPPTQPEVGGEWVEVVVELRRFGVGRATEAALSARELQRSPENVRSLLRYAKGSNLGPGLVFLVCLGKREWPPEPTPATVPTPPRPSPLSAEDEFRAYTRHRLMADGVRGEELITRVESAVAAWRDRQCQEVPA
jgi:hypothetical protein